MGSAELAQLEVEIQERSLFSSKTLIESVLEKYLQRIPQILAPRQVRRPDRVTPENPEGWVTEAPDAGTVRLEIRRLLASAGHVTDPDKAGTIQDLSSDPRINLVIDHNVAEARAYGHHIQATDPDFADAFPAQELVRMEQRNEPRDWDVIWQSALAEVGDQAAISAYNATGRTRFVARKDSEVWLEISDFNRPWPPFKFGSGMGLRDVSRREAMDLGLIDRDTQIAVPRRAFNDGLEEAA